MASVEDEVPVFDPTMKKKKKKKVTEDAEAEEKPAAEASSEEVTERVENLSLDAADFGKKKKKKKKTEGDGEAGELEAPAEGGDELAGALPTKKKKRRKRLWISRVLMSSSPLSLPPRRIKLKLRRPSQAAVSHGRAQSVTTTTKSCSGVCLVC